MLTLRVCVDYFRSHEDSLAVGFATSQRINILLDVDVYAPNTILEANRHLRSFLSGTGLIWCWKRLATNWRAFHVLNQEMVLGKNTPPGLCRHFPHARGTYCCSFPLDTVHWFPILTRMFRQNSELCYPTFHCLLPLDWLTVSYHQSSMASRCWLSFYFSLHGNFVRAFMIYHIFHDSCKFG